MGTTITLSAPSFGSIVITGDGVHDGLVYDKLIGWQDIDGVDLGFQKRPNAPGSFGPNRTYPDGKVISIEGQMFANSRTEALQARENLTAAYNDGEPITMTVTDDLRATSRQIAVKSIKFPWTIHQQFKYTFDAEAADPKRYGATARVGTTLAVPGGGLPFPLVYPLDFGALPVDGRVLVTNSGNTETVSIYTVSGGQMLDGFALVNVDTGERLTYLGPVTSGTTIVLDTASMTAFINGTAPAGRFLPSPEWWTVPAKGVRTIQFIALGPVTGTPRVDIDTAPAFY